MTIDLTPEERAEVIRAIKEQHPGTGPDADVEGFFKTKPLTLHFYAMIVRGLLKDSRAATDTYLRSLSNDLLEVLVMALDKCLLGNEAEKDTEVEKRGADAVTAMILLVVTERRKDRRVQLMVETFECSEAELFTFAQRFAGLAGVEALRRLGVVKWVDRYTLLEPFTDKQTRRVMASEPHNGH